MGNTSNRRFFKFLLFGGILAVLFPLTKLAFFALSPYQSGSPRSAYILVHKGQSPNEITKLLIQENIISDGKTFLWVGRLSRLWKRIKAGEYRVSSSMTPVEIFSTLTSGISAAHPITVREGENMYEIATDLESKGLVSEASFLSFCKDPQFISSLGFNSPLPDTLEGYFFPDTYFFNRTMSAAEIARQMVRHFREYWNKQLDERATQLGMTQHQVVTLASIIEKETGAPEERPIISSVFHNRLKKHMRLQSDPTTIYGMWDRFKGKIHKTDLSVKNPYNTYTIPGLPIGPISNPGKEAIEATLHPAETPYLYFVSHNDGTHQFSKTFEEHNRAVQKFQVDPKAREGKSWRDRLKKTNQLQSP